MENKSSHVSFVELLGRSRINHGLLVVFGVLVDVINDRSEGVVPLNSEFIDPFEKLSHTTGIIKSQ